MKQRHLLTLGPAGFYAPVPTVVLDASGALADFNMAARLVLGPRLESCRDAPRATLRAHFDETMQEAVFAVPARGPGNPGDPPPAPPRLRVDTSRFGPLEVEVSRVTVLAPDTGERAGTVVYLVPREHAPRGFRDDLAAESRHQEAWDAYAASYDRVLPVLPFYEAAVRRHVHALAPRAGHHILDLGAGTGNVTMELLQEGARVTALDLSRAMLTRLRYKARATSNATLTVLEQNAEHLDRFPDATFDGVSILLALYDMDAPARALAEALRVLRPGGTLVITEPRRRFRLEPLLEAAEGHLRERGLREQLADDWATVNRANRVLDPARRQQRLFAEDVAERVADAGFTNLVEQDSHHGHCATLTAMRGAEAAPGPAAAGRGAA